MYLLSLAIDPFHHSNLSCSLVGIRLIDADCVNPDGCCESVLAKLQEGFVEVLGNGERLMIAHDIGGISRAAPNIGKSIVLDTAFILVLLQDADIDIVRPASTVYQDQACFVLGERVITLELLG